MRLRGVSAASLSTRVASKCVPSVLMSPERLTCVRMRWDERVAMWMGKCSSVCEGCVGPVLFESVHVPL